MAGLNDLLSWLASNSATCAAAHELLPPQDVGSHKQNLNCSTPRIDFLPLPTQLFVGTLLARMEISTPFTVWPYIILIGGREEQKSACPWA